MQSGINDWDWPSFDAELLALPASVHLSPLHFLNAVAAQHNRTAPPEPFACDPGECVCYSSTNFILAGILLVQHQAVPGGSEDWWRGFDEQAFLPADTYAHSRF